MHSVIPETKARKFRGTFTARRTPGDRLRDALIELAAGNATVLTHEEKAWASVTFSGSRHELTLDFDGPEAVLSGELFSAVLPDHEFAIPGQLVADALVSGIDHRVYPHPRMVVSVTVLMLVDA